MQPSLQHTNFIRISSLEGNRELLAQVASGAIKVLKEKGYTVEVSDDSIPLTPGRSVPRIGSRGMHQVVQRQPEPTDPVIFTVTFKKQTKQSGDK